MVQGAVNTALPSLTLGTSDVQGKRAGGPVPAALGLGQFQRARSEMGYHVWTEFYSELEGHGAASPQPRVT